MRAERRKAGQTIGELRREGGDTGEAESAAAVLRSEIATLADQLEEVESGLRALMLQLPNIPDPRVPEGGKEANQVVKVWGERPAVTNLRDHVEIATAPGLIDYERGTKMGGSGFWVY